MSGRDDPVTITKGIKMLIMASDRTVCNIRMRVLQSMTADEYCNIFGTHSDFPKDHSLKA